MTAPTTAPPSSATRSDSGRTATAPSIIRPGALRGGSSGNASLQSRSSCGRSASRNDRMATSAFAVTLSLSASDAFDRITPPAPHDDDRTPRLIRSARAASDGERQRALALLRRHGWNATSFQILEPGFLYWFDGQRERPHGGNDGGNDDACVAYLDTGQAWVAAGAPIAGPDRVAEVAVKFVAAAAAHRRRACFFGTEDRFATAAPFAAMRIGEQADWDPFAWDEALRATRSLREQIRRSRAKGVTVRAFDP